MEDELIRRIVKLFKGKELLKIGNRSYINAFKYPLNRFDRKELLPDGGDPGLEWMLHWYTIVPPSSLIFKWGDGLVYDKKWWGRVYGGIPNASAVIQSALNALTPNRTWKERVVLKGDFALSYISGNGYINLPSYVVLDIQGRLTIVDEPTRKPVITNSDHSGAGQTDIDIVGGIIDGSASTVSRAAILLWYNVYNSIIEGVTVKNFIGVSPYSALGIGTYVCRNISILNNRVEKIGSPTDGGFGEGIQVIGGFHHLIQGNYVYWAYRGIRIQTQWSGSIYPKHRVIGNKVEKTSEGIDIFSASENVVMGNTIYDNFEAEGKTDFGAIMIDAMPASPAREANYNVVVGNYIEKRAKIFVKGCYNVISHNVFKDIYAVGGAPAAIHLYSALQAEGAQNSMYNEVSGNILYNSGSVVCPAIWEEQGAGAVTDYNNIVGNVIYGNWSSPAIVKVGANTKVRFNVGFPTENSGEATVPAEATYVDVPHGLAITPDVNRIKVTPKDSLGGRSFWVSNVTATTFRINISLADTVDHVFGWSYE